jgi:hypothetical protein
MNEHRLTSSSPSAVPVGFSSGAEGEGRIVGERSAEGAVVSDVVAGTRFGGCEIRPAFAAVSWG